MGRPRRIQFAGACYLVTLQGQDRSELFASHQDRRRFLGLLAAARARFGLKIYAYCLLPQRALLLLQTARPNLASAMQSLGTAYTKHFNAAHGSSGRVFQGRYRALLVDRERHLAEMTRYVHLEPVRSGLTERPWRYQWSSCAHYVQLLEKKTLVEPDEVLLSLGRNRLTASVRYLKTLKERMKAASDLLIPVTRGQAVGREPFLERARGLAEEPARTPEDRPARLASARRIIAEVARDRGLDEERLLGRLQWRELCAARREAVGRIWREVRLGVTEIGRLFGRTPSAISQTLRKLA